MDSVNMSNVVWEEIHGFTSLGEYNRFVLYIGDQVATGHIREIDSDPEYGQGEIYGGRWFEDICSGDVWRLVPPDIPFKGLWEPVSRRAQ